VLLFITTKFSAILASTRNKEQTNIPKPIPYEDALLQIVIAKMKLATRSSQTLVLIICSQQSLHIFAPQFLQTQINSSSIFIP